MAMLTSNGALHTLYATAVEQADKGEFENALATIERAIAMRPDPRFLSCKAKALAGLGRQAEADKVLDDLTRTVEDFLDAARTFGGLQTEPLGPRLKTLAQAVEGLAGVPFSAREVRFPSLEAMVAELDSTVKSIERNEVKDNAMLCEAPRPKLGRW
jgi:hypothetical protein